MCIFSINGAALYASNERMDELYILPGAIPGICAKKKKKGEKLRFTGKGIFICGLSKLPGTIPDMNGRGLFGYNIHSYGIYACMYESNQARDGKNRMGEK